eukprot:12996668-Heterocapsa_arctica.AAC.1
MAAAARLRADMVERLRIYSEAAETVRDEERREACEVQAPVRATGEQNMTDENADGGDDAAGGGRAGGG